MDISPDPLPANVPYPTFEWFYGPDKVLIPSGVTQLAMIRMAMPILALCTSLDCCLLIWECTPVV